MSDAETQPTFMDEVGAAIKDIAAHVRSADVSTKLPPDPTAIYINLTTLEGHRFCIEMTGLGFRIVGKDFDNTDDIETCIDYNETLYSLLSIVSEAYRTSFCNVLSDKLTALKKSREE